ncbi:MAG: hypothetical protein ACOC2M_01770 [bacterium]
MMKYGVFRIFMIIAVAFIGIKWSVSMAGENPIYATMRWPIAIVTFVGFALTQLQSNILSGMKRR